MSGVDEVAEQGVECLGLIEASVRDGRAMDAIELAKVLHVSYTNLRKSGAKHFLLMACNSVFSALLCLFWMGRYIFAENGGWSDLAFLALCLASCLMGVVNIGAHIRMVDFIIWWRACYDQLRESLESDDSLCMPMGLPDWRHWDPDVADSLERVKLAERRWKLRKEKENETDTSGE